MAALSGAADSYVRGTVALDGRPQRGILVSNGDTVVKTDKKGEYTLPVIEDMCIFPILSADRTIEGHKIINTAFPAVGYGDSHRDFNLIKRKIRNNFTMNAIGDLQVGNGQEIEYASRTLWPELMADSTSHLDLWLGDLVNNNLGLYPRIRTMLEMLPAKSFTLVGNHDRDIDSVRTRQTASFSHVLGAPVYSFNEGNVHFIVLNTVYGDGTRSYKGRIDARQLRFVKEDLKHVPVTRQIVICAHIPLSNTCNAEELIALLENRGNVLAITGHEHCVARNFLKGEGVLVHELVAGAACGFWWVGEKDWEGIPSALQQCGTPKGYFRFNFSPDGYDFSFKGTGMDPGRQIGIWIAGLDSITHKNTPVLSDIKAHEAIATVYGGCDSTRVECMLDGRIPLPAEKISMIDPNVARIREMNQRKIYPTKESRRNPLRKTASPQIWRIFIPEDIMLNGCHYITITASDSFGFRASGQRPL